MDPPERETALHQMLQKLLIDERYSDVVLKGSDGSLTHANRALLAARSNVFDRMLYGRFAESRQTEICLDFHGTVLKDLVEYIYTDSNAILLAKVSDLAASARNEGFVPRTIALMQASVYFELPKLCEKVETVAIRALEVDPSLCVLFYAASEVILEGSVLEEKALEKIRMEPRSTLLSDSNDEVRLLSSSRLEQILKHQEIQTDEFTLFQILHRWSLQGPLLSDAPMEDEGAEDADDAAASEIDDAEMDVETAENNNRLQKATELVHHIALELISPSKLLATVAHSGLITAPQLAEAIQKQAALSPSCYDRPRWRHVTWRHSRGIVLVNDSPHQTLLDMLTCPPMVDGIHKWQIRVEHVMQNTGVSLGVVSSTLTNSSSPADNNHDKEKWLQQFRKCSTVTFTLDLTGSGTLSARVVDDDGGTAVQQTFSDTSMLTNLRTDYGENAGFLPAARLYLGNQVRFLSRCSGTESTI